MPALLVASYRGWATSADMIRRRSRRRRKTPQIMEGHHKGVDRPVTVVTTARRRQHDMMGNHDSRGVYLSTTLGRHAFFVILLQITCHVMNASLNGNRRSLRRHWCNLVSIDRDDANAESIWANARLLHIRHIR